MKKKGQEEMVGFILIIVIVAVILLIFLGFALRNSKDTEIKSYEVQGFLQSVLQYTSDCEDALGFLSIQDLIFSCDRGGECSDGSACEVLNSTLKEISEESWNVREGSYIKGYEFKIVPEDAEIGTGIFWLEQGNVTKNYRGASQDFRKRGQDYEVLFKLYN